MSTAIEDIAAERQRQIDKEGWSAEHDDYEHRNGDLGDAAACYAATGPIFKAEQRQGTGYNPILRQLQTFTMYLPLWPWADRWWKPKDRRRNLVKAGALIVAEIERLDRAAAKEAGTGTLLAKDAT